MTRVEDVKSYSPFEESINIGSHAVGLLLSLIGTAMLVVRAMSHGDSWDVVGAGIFGASLIVLYGASTCYHSARMPALRSRLRIVDHASIYVLIAGTYTPLTLVTLNGNLGFAIFGIVWTMAVTGVILKLFFTGRFNLVSTLMYVFMGWLIVFAIKPLRNNLEWDGLLWLVAGGLAYTLGAVLYSIKRIPLNHAIFHLFVLLGSASHFIAVYKYVLP
jgi:hemolysin III